MKINRKEMFSPITIIIETRQEEKALRHAISKAKESLGMFSHLTQVQQDTIRSIDNFLNEKKEDKINPVKVNVFQKEKAYPVGTFWDERNCTSEE